MPTVGWTQQQPSTSPSARAYAWTAYDAAHGYVLLFGGFDGVAWHGDTWWFDGTNWILKFPPRSPIGRAGHAMAAFGGKVVIFGGYNNGDYYSDTWVYDGSTWHPGPNGPTARSALGLSLDTARGNMVLFGGRNLTIPQYFDETWILS